MFESMMKWSVGLLAVGCVLAMSATAGADFEYSASRTVGAELFPGVCTRVVVANDGTWLMLRRCHADGSGPGATDHTGQVFLARSDDGETWTNYGADGGRISNDEYSAINAEFIKYPNGHIEIFYTRYTNVGGHGQSHTPNMVSRSTDNGSTWSNFQAAVSPLNEPSSVMWQDVSVGNTTYLARYGWQGGPTFSKTTDNGNSWTDVSSITTEAEDGIYHEPGLAYLGNGEFLAVLRDNNKGHTLQKRSMDWGQTWQTEGYIKSDGSVNPSKTAGTNVVLHQCRMWTEDINGNNLGYIYMQANLYPGHYPRNMYAYFSADGGASWGSRSLLELRAHDSALVLKSRSSAKYYPGREVQEGNGLITCDDIDIVAPPLIPGDANGDNVVNDEDASILAAHWQQPGGWSDGDFNDDGVVDDKDASILAAHWHETSEGAPVPEPGTLVLLAGALLSLLVWRRR